jgi:hypothetical protein
VQVTVSPKARSAKGGYISALRVSFVSAAYDKHAYDFVAHAAEAFSKRGF